MKNRSNIGEYIERQRNKEMLLGHSNAEILPSFMSLICDSGNI